jgi:tetratricopeptide (TPR) repeat protein
MVARTFRARFHVTIAGALLLTFLFAPAALCQPGNVGDAGHHNEQGIGYFKKGFYDHAPKNQVGEAERNYGLAIKEFRAAISQDPSYTEAHRNLARVYYVQKDFKAAAEQYQKVTELAPQDLDAYVNLALALIELYRLDEAIGVLENAKRETSDPKARDTLDTYVAKIRAHEPKEVR